MADTIATTEAQPTEAQPTEAPPTEAQPTAAKTGRKARASTRNAQPPAGGAVYGLGLIGALVYFIGTAKTGPDYVLAFGKAMVWPALLVYKAFRTLGG